MISLTFLMRLPQKVICSSYFSAIKDGYESDSTLTFKRREDVSAPTPHTPSEAKSLYSQIQKGGDIPVSGLRMTVPERPKGKRIELRRPVFFKCSKQIYEQF